MRRTSNCLWQFSLAARAASRRSSKSHTGECPKTGHSPHRFEIPRSGIMEVSVRSTSKTQQQRLLREEVLSLTQENAQKPGILRTDLGFGEAESWRLV